jgi:glycosyltransferase involved in cell wall biosynthesis
MRVLWLSWKDMRHPLAGGAERVQTELVRRLIADGHEVTLLVGGFPGGTAEETVDGCRVIRVGGRWTVYWRAWRYYRRHLRGWADLVIDEVNTVPFFAKFYVREHNILLVHMLCRRIWFYEIFFPLSFVGYLVEPIYLRMLRDRQVITVSESTKRDLTRYGFNADKIGIISEGIETAPLADPSAVTKFAEPTLLSLGAVRPMKRTLDQVKVFELAKDRLPNLRLKIAGDVSGSYGRRVLAYAAASCFAEDIECLGRVSPEQKFDLMRRSHLLLVTSVKEGWGLTVTEAAGQGTPAVVYNVDGLRDSVQDGRTGLVARANTPAALAELVVGLLGDPTRYAALREAGWRWSHDITFDQSYKQFIGRLKELTT